MTTSIPTAERKSTTLLVLASLFVLLSIFDNTIVLSGIPMLRNPAAVAALLLVFWFTVFGVNALKMTDPSQWWAIGVLSMTLVIELIRIIIQGHVMPGWLSLYLQWVQVLIIFFILLDLAKDPRALHYIGISFLLAMMYIAFSSLLTPDGFAVEGGQRLGYEGENLNRQAYWFAMAFIILTWLMFERWPRVGLLGILLLLGAGLQFYCLLRSGSRAAFLGMLLGLLCLLVVGFRKEKLSAYLVLLPFMLMATAFLLLNNDLVIERIIMALYGSQDGMRSSIFSAAAGLFMEKPFLGQGMFFSELLGKELGLSSGLASHNSFLRVILNFGIITGIVWLCLLLSIFFKCWKGRGIAALFLSLMVLSLVYGTFDEIQFNKFFWVMLALASQAPLHSHFNMGYRAEVHYGTVP
ncbi:O-antigen ligase family protein [Halomonas sp. LR5S13]|uniref:O-antigen ligase family protein n=1 Tax=Halomonas rhizosphaerae TaxID=3043296 RepID=UPI0024A9F73E|nr:O-antigen ligase family protein [Halomonas rhizosphaerae]MDI5920855.1 O-antigen ligase family protein [Halomonas rhizosphaerae]